MKRDQSEQSLSKSASRQSIGPRAARSDASALEARLYGSFASNNLRLSAASPVLPVTSNLAWNNADTAQTGPQRSQSTGLLPSASGAIAANYTRSLVPRVRLSKINQNAQSQQLLPTHNIANAGPGDRASTHSLRDSHPLPHTATLARNSLSRTSLHDEKKEPNHLETQLNPTAAPLQTLLKASRRSQGRKDTILSGKGRMNFNEGVVTYSNSTSPDTNEFTLEAKEDTANPPNEEGTTLNESSLYHTRGRSAARTFIESLNLDSSRLYSLAEGNFLYLRRCDFDQSTAYDLEAVDHADTNPDDYYTMSRAGVTHFFGNESEFSTLDQWEREYRLFGAIRNMHGGNNFFLRFPIWKSFMLWKKAVTLRKKRHAAEVLGTQLFMLKSTLRRALSRVKHLCLEVQEWRIFTRDKFTTYTLSEFSEEQATKRRHVGSWLIDFSNDVRAIVRAACDAVLDSFLDDNRIRPDQKMSFMERAALRSECRKLTDFIRLCDFLVRDTLLNMALDSTEELCNAIAPHVDEFPLRIIVTDDKSIDVARKEAATEIKDKDPVAILKQRVMPLLVVAASVHCISNGTDPLGHDGKHEMDEIQTEVQLEPSLHGIKARIQTAIAKGLSVAASTPRLLTHEDLLPYTQAAADDAGAAMVGRQNPSDNSNDLVAEIMRNNRYKKMENTMWHELEKAFTDVQQFCTVFMPFAQKYFANIAEESIISTKYDSDTPIKTFSELIAKFSNQGKEFHEMPRLADIGIIRVDSEATKQLLMPSPLRCLHEIRMLLPKLAFQRAEELINQARGMTRVLSSQPADVELFVQKVEILERAQEQLPTIREHEAHSRALADLMNANEWPLDDELFALFRMMRDEVGRLESATQTAEARLDEDTKRFAAQIEAAIPQLKREVLAIRERMDEPMIGNPAADVQQVIRYIDAANTDMSHLQEQARRYQHYQSMLKQSVIDFDALGDVAADLQLKLNLWSAIASWEDKIEDWRTMPFHEMDPEALDKEVQQYLKTAIRSERGLPGNGAAPKLRAMIEDFKGLVPVVRDLRSDALQSRHWEEIEEIIHHEFDEEKTYTLGELLDLQVAEHAVEISAVATKAVQEKALLKLFERKVTTVWDTMEFIVLPYKESKDVFILGSVEEISAAIDESLVTINTILGSRFAGALRSDVETWQRKLVLLSDTLDEWLTCQKQWMYLETIFAADDIKRQLAEESKRFSSVDKNWKTIMRRTNNNPKAVLAGTVKGLKEQLARHNETLDAIQKSLEDYLETKRLAFPRFYFLSNEELLDILAQTRDPQAVQPHLRKCFDALYRLRFGTALGSIEIEAMRSQEGEEIILPKNLKARGKVEEWLMAVQNGMIESLREAMKTGVETYTLQPRATWVLAHPGQIVATVAQIMWCYHTEEALKAPDPLRAMQTWYEQNLRQLSDLTLLVRGQLTPIERKVIVALVTTDVHARDILETMVHEKVSDVGTFTWQQQLRYYWEPQAMSCIVRQSNSVIPYGYEYQGCTSRLVITPLTDRCWMTITGAVNLKLGAAPAGPAGTGKTESSKDLAKALGIQCIVFNCSEQIDYKMLGKLFSGLAQSGAWTCLDEFNRIDIEVLSVVAQQLQQLRQGKLSGATHIHFEGRAIDLKEHCVIITMNPGYAGRTELPDNLKILFRPVAMMVPDYALIAEIILFAEGFEDAKALSRKMVKLYRLSSEQLSQQKHYDFGMRAVKSVLVMAGALKRASPDLSEDVVLIRAMRDSNVPKFLGDDLPLFHAIIRDLFPKVRVPANDFGDLQHSIKEQLVEKGLQPVPAFMEKAVQLFETLNVRFGVVIVGPTGAGKTTCYRTLQSSMTALAENDHEDKRFQLVSTFILNPKCITMGELYGEMNEVTQEWQDGLASSIMRSHTLMEDPSKKWTVFDGPIDALWIENMNTVLDDNMTLCLANGERVKLRPEMRMLFEVADLEQASPATVSRLGVVYMTPEDLGWRPFVKSWMPIGLPSNMPSELKQHLWERFDLIIDSALKVQRNQCVEPLSTVDIQLVASLCHLLTALLYHENIQDKLGYFTASNQQTSATTDLGEDETNKKDIPTHPAANVPSQKVFRWDRPLEDMQDILDTLFIFSLTWSIGASIHAKHHEIFNSWLKGLDVFKQLRLGPNSIYDVFPDLTQMDVPWQKWSTAIPPFVYDRTKPYFSMVVPTLDTTRFSYLLALQTEQLNPVFFTGITGTGKTVVIQDMLNRASAEDYNEGYSFAPVMINFSAQTSAKRTQLTIESKLEKKKKHELGAPSGKKVVVFVDDVNMPSVEEYGAQPPIELLRQFCDFHGFYDREKLFWKDITDTVLVAAAAPPGGGRADITQRFTRHFHVLCMPPSSDSVLKHIFGSIIDGFLSVFPDSVRGCASRAVSATIDVYNRIREEMKPTPAKSHYTFNLRDVSKVIQGILMIHIKDCQTPDVLARLWAHETCRVFHDRLISSEDKKWFTEHVVHLLHKTWGRGGDGWEHDQLFGAEPLLFVNFLSPPLEDGPGNSRYEEVRDWNKLKGVLDDALEDYNLTHANHMDLVFFSDAVQHVARISRILSQRRGNAMLVGVGGSGKQSLTRMACSLCEAECIMIELTRGYDQTAFREDLKKMMLKAGVGGEQVTFLFTDTQIVNDSFLEDINNVLNTGEIPSLFETDEFNQIVDDIRPAAQEQQIPETRDNLWRFFISRVRDNLHIVLAMSPVGDAFRVRCRQFPSLINCCTIDWFLPWPHDALLSVCHRFIADADLGTANDFKPQIAEVCVAFHVSMSAWSDKCYQELQRKIYTTPKSYLDLIQLYLKMLVEKQSELNELRTTLSTGVTKLEAANSQVADLQGTLTRQQPVLAQKSKETTELLERVRDEQSEADKIKEKVVAEESVVRGQKEEVAAVQADAQKDLDVALPALESAMEALNKLDKKDVTEVRSFSKPPPAVQTVMEAVCVLLGEKPDWDSAKRVLSKSDFMDTLVNYPKDDIPASTLKKLRKYIDDPIMQVSEVSKVSKAATSLCMWCHAMDVYARVAKEVEPKRQRLQEMNDQLEAANKTLQTKQDMLQSVLDRVAELQRKADETVAEKDRLESEQQLTKERLVRAEQLTNGLAGEQVRWKESIQTLDEQIQWLTGDVLVASASVSYFGPFTGTYRQQMVQQWLGQVRDAGIPCSSNYSLTQTLGDPVQIREWQINGLPPDSVSTDNAILVTRGERWPLLIDPQEQAKRWIKNTELRNRLAITRLSNNNMLRDLESCIRIGRPLLLEDVGEFLDPALEPVLAKAVFKQQGRLLIHLGDSDVDYDPTFRLYISTKMPNPHYLPEICIRVTVINFSITADGLEDQLLGAAVRKERPDVEQKKNELVLSMASDRKQLKDLENKILKLLRESSGNILDDTALIRVLKESKAVAKVTNERLTESEKTQETINQAREEYRSVAVRGTMLYFVIADLALLDPMYQYSLSYFVKLFNQCIDDAEQSNDTKQRIINLRNYLTTQAYTNVCRGLFEAHKLIFSFLMCIQIMRRDGKVSDAQWMGLLRGAGMIENPTPNPMPDTLSFNGWNLLYALEQNGCGTELNGICNHVTENTETWFNWATQPEPHVIDMPEPWQSSLSHIQRMLILKAWREEKLWFAIKDFVAVNMGPQFVENPSVSMQDIFADSDASTPVIFILSVGADPTGMLFTYAKQKEYTERLKLISLGQGQGPRAQSLIESAAATGDWVLLQNCHLAKSWLPQLEKIVDELQEAFKSRISNEGGSSGIINGTTTNTVPTNTTGRIIRKKLHPDFRLFLTSMPASYFPVPVLQNGVKLTNEPPKGIRANLKRSLNQLESWTPFNDCPGNFESGSLAGQPKLPVWQKLAFGLCFFHAVIQERRKFGPLGWNITYEFNDSDLETSMLVLKQFLLEQPLVPWDALTYVTGHINYGGRVTDDWDRRCLMDILAEYYTPLMLDSSYKFSKSGTYYSPPPGPLESFKSYVDQLPLNDNPEIFGMHENANISYQTRETQNILSACLRLQPRSSGASSTGTDDPDQIVLNVASDIFKSVPLLLKREEANPTTFIKRDHHMDSLSTVLLQEMSRFNTLLTKMKNSLTELQRAIRGEVLMSDELDHMYTSFLNNRVPHNWSSVAYPSLKPLASWFKDLRARVAFLRNWLQNGRPKAFWMSGFFFPQGFMTGTLQNHARKYAIPIDTLGFRFTVLDAMTAQQLNAKEVPEDGVLIEGMYMEGARWNHEYKLISEPAPGEMYDPIPIVHFMPERDHVIKPTDYCAPLYKTSTRAGTLSTTGISTNFILAVEFPVAPDETPKKYALLGAALLTQLDD